MSTNFWLCSEVYDRLKFNWKHRIQNGVHHPRWHCLKVKATPRGNNGFADGTRFCCLCASDHMIENHLKMCLPQLRNSVRSRRPVWTQWPGIDRFHIITWGKKIKNIRLRLLNLKEFCSFVINWKEHKRNRLPIVPEQIVLYYDPVIWSLMFVGTPRRTPWAFLPGMNSIMLPDLIITLKETHTRKGIWTDALWHKDVRNSTEKRPEQVRH